MVWLTLLYSNAYTCIYVYSDGMYCVRQVLSTEVVSPLIAAINHTNYEFKCCYRMFFNDFVIKIKYSDIIDAGTLLAIQIGNALLGSPCFQQFEKLHY